MLTSNKITTVSESIINWLFCLNQLVFYNTRKTKMIKFSKIQKLIILIMISAVIGIGVFKGTIDPSQINNSINNSVNIMQEINNINR